MGFAAWFAATAVVRVSVVGAVDRTAVTHFLPLGLTAFFAATAVIAVTVSVVRTDGTAEHNN
jgi:hypothetical protein